VKIVLSNIYYLSALDTLKGKDIRVGATSSLIRGGRFI
jgi:hypothetical protein